MYLISKNHFCKLVYSFGLILYKQMKNRTFHVNSIKFCSFSSLSVVNYFASSKRSLRAKLFAYPGPTVYAPSMISRIPITYVLQRSTMPYVSFPFSLFVKLCTNNAPYISRQWADNIDTTQVIRSFL